jgi:hypothetical protein
MQCSIELDRKAIAEAAQQPSATLKLKKHEITCKLGHKDPKDGSACDLKLSIEPTVSFESGKALKATMGWGLIEAPVLAKTAIWSATAVDANFAVISSGVVKAGPPPGRRSAPGRSRGFPIGGRSSSEAEAR